MEIKIVDITEFQQFLKDVQPKLMDLLKNPKAKAKDEYYSYSTREEREKGLQAKFEFLKQIEEINDEIKEIGSKLVKAVPELQMGWEAWDIVYDRGYNPMSATDSGLFLKNNKGEYIPLREEKCVGMKWIGDEGAVVDQFPSASMGKLFYHVMKISSYTYNFTDIAKDVAVGAIEREWERPPLEQQKKAIRIVEQSFETAHQSGRELFNELAQWSRPFAGEKEQRENTTFSWLKRQVRGILGR